MKFGKHKFMWLGIVTLFAVVAIVAMATPWGRSLAHYVVREGRSAVVASVPSAGLEPKHVRQLVSEDMSTSRIIMWDTEKVQDNPVVLYKEKGAADTTIVTVPATREEFTEDKVTRHIYRAKLENLKPNMDYEYSVGSNTSVANWHDLSTKISTDFTALVFPDSQSSDYSGWKSLLKTAYAQNPKVAFFVNMGDLVDNGESSYQLEEWFDAVEPMLETVPFAGVTGNHEYYSLDWKFKSPTAFDQFFRFDSQALLTGANKSDNPKDMSRRAFYSYDYGDVHFVVLNTQFQEMDESYREEVAQEQLAWLKQDLANTSKQWKVVFMHRDPFRYPHTKNPNIEPGFSDMGDMFMPIFDEYKVDLVLSAHYHMYRRRGHVEDFKRSDSGPYYIITGVAGDVKYANIWRSHPLDEYVSPYVDGDNYLVLDKVGQNLTVKAYLQDGTLFDEVTISK
ncbi:MAG: metallophosphoesterase family protein [Veillonella caviae]|nr:metallophosphoesterase family protein [Veillonella caviae]